MNFKDTVKQAILDNFVGDITPAQMIIVLSAALAFGIYIFYIYRVTVNNEFYSKDFNKTLVLMSVTTAAIVLAIQSNLVISLGMVGALSIVRFRTAVKSPLDLFFLFWSISMGIVCGAGLYLIACVASVGITITLFLMDRFQSPVALGLLVIHCNDLGVCNEAVEVIKNHTKYARIKNKTIGKACVELIVEIKANSDEEIEEALNKIEGIHKFAFMNFDRETRI